VRADVILEKFVAHDDERSGAAIDRRDPRLVEGDALAMPFADLAFDYAVASHVAEHVEDPAQLCRELSRVARAGYVETPGWLGDIIMREPFHRWRVRKRGRQLVFTEVTNPRPLGRLGDWLYAVCYIGRLRPGHRSITSDHPILRPVFTAIRYAVAGLFRVPGIRGRLWLRHEWSDQLYCEVRRSYERGSTA
jgi:SAM-dependent methyltransferase